MAAVKLPPLRNTERAIASAAYEHEHETAPKSNALAIERGRSSGSSHMRRANATEELAGTWVVVRYVHMRAGHCLGSASSRTVRGVLHATSSRSSNTRTVFLLS